MFVKLELLVGLVIAAESFNDDPAVAVALEPDVVAKALAVLESLERLVNTN